MIWLDMVHPHDRVHIDRAIDAYLSQSTDVIAVEYRIKHRKGHYVWVQSFGR
jgi:hypothetical protein